jgi:cytochrome bd-type quinol oxidase subunit 2
MSKIIIGVAVIVLLGGTWLYLDNLEKQQREATQQMRQVMEEARTHAKVK